MYGLRASLFLASIETRKYISIQEISEKLDIPFYFLTKVLQQLTQAGLMESKKGSHGGVRLTKSETKISLFEIIEAIDGKDLFTECLLGLPGCGIRKPCPVHEEWKTNRDCIEGMFKETNLAELAGKSKKINLRITTDGKFEWNEI